MNFARILSNDQRFLFKAAANQSLLTGAAARGAAGAAWPPGRGPEPGERGPPGLPLFRVFGPSVGLLRIERAMRWRGRSTSVTVTVTF